MNIKFLACGEMWYKTKSFQLYNMEQILSASDIRLRSLLISNVWYWFHWNVHSNFIFWILLIEIVLGIPNAYVHV